MLHQNRGIDRSNVIAKFVYPMATMNLQNLFTMILCFINHCYVTWLNNECLHQTPSLMGLTLYICNYLIPHRVCEKTRSRKLWTPKHLRDARCGTMFMRNCKTSWLQKIEVTGASKPEKSFSHLCWAKQPA